MRDSILTSEAYQHMWFVVCDFNRELIEHPSRFRDYAFHFLVELSLSCTDTSGNIGSSSGFLQFRYSSFLIQAQSCCLWPATIRSSCGGNCHVFRHIETMPTMLFASDAITICSFGSPLEQGRWEACHLCSFLYSWFSCCALDILIWI